MICKKIKIQAFFLILFSSVCLLNFNARSQLTKEQIKEDACYFTKMFERSFELLKVIQQQIPLNSVAMSMLHALTLNNKKVFSQIQKIQQEVSDLIHSHKLDIIKIKREQHENINLIDTNHFISKIQTEIDEINKKITQIQEERQTPNDEIESYMPPSAIEKNIQLRQEAQSLCQMIDSLDLELQSISQKGDLIIKRWEVFFSETKELSHSTYLEVFKRTQNTTKQAIKATILCLKLAEEILKITKKEKIKKYHQLLLEQQNITNKQNILEAIERHLLYFKEMQNQQILLKLKVQFSDQTKIQMTNNIGTLDNYFDEVLSNPVYSESLSVT
ncbi:MAG: hypothetical protein HAW62_02045 [Endozoicomonadaceae bacterium]|nr:hypothetical protein [Endozoicomonadaceae bacterium]